MARAFGQISTSAGTKAAIEATTYTEQTTSGQRSLASSSAADAAAGTGARTVRLTYFSWDGATMLGPFVETVTLNGVTPVATVGTNIGFIEKIEVMTAGSGGVAAGTISLFVNNAGGGGTIGTIATGAVRTLWAHHYVASKKQCRVTDVMASGGDAAQAAFELDVLSYPAGIEQPITGPGVALAAKTASVQVLRQDSARQPIPGPARVRAYVTPANVNAQLSSLEFGFIDDVVVFP